MLMAENGVPLSQIVEEFELEILYKSSDFDKISITVDDVNRPGLQLAGFYNHFSNDRLQVIGLVETSYLSGQTEFGRYNAYNNLFAHGIPGLIISRGQQVQPECLTAAKENDVTVMRSQESTSEILSTLIATLKVYLSPKITRHGVFVEVAGEGVLIMGESGVGKSETAIELVNRGHRLIADDAVELKKVTAHSIVGSAPELIRHYIEIRGIGIIDVRRLFGMGAVKDSAELDLVVQLEDWNENTSYDRLGIESQYMDIMGVMVPTVTVPVKPGRNLAVILEIAAMNNRQKKMGYNAAQEFTDQISRHFDEVLGASDNESEQ